MVTAPKRAARSPLPSESYVKKTFRAVREAGFSTGKIEVDLGSKTVLRITAGEVEPSPVAHPADAPELPSANEELRQFKIQKAKDNARRPAGRRERDKDAS